MTASRCAKMRMAQAGGVLVLSFGVALGPQAVAQQDGVQQPEATEGQGAEPAQITVAEDGSVTVMLPNGETRTLSPALAADIMAAVEAEDTAGALGAALENAGVEGDAATVTAAAAYASSRAGGDMAKIQAIVDGAARSNPEAAGDAVLAASQASGASADALVAGMQGNPDVSPEASGNAAQAVQQASTEVAEAEGAGTGDALINPSSEVTENPSQDTSPIQ